MVRLGSRNWLEISAPAQRHGGPGPVGGLGQLRASWWWPWELLLPASPWPRPVGSHCGLQSPDRAPWIPGPSSAVFFLSSESHFWEIRLRVSPPRAEQGRDGGARRAGGGAPGTLVVFCATPTPCHLEPRSGQECLGSVGAAEPACPWAWPHTLPEPAARLGRDNDRRAGASPHSPVCP